MRGYKPWLQIGIKYEIFLNNKYPIDVFKNQNFCTMVDICWTFCTFQFILTGSSRLISNIFCSLNFGLVLSNFLLFESLISKDHYDTPYYTRTKSEKLRFILPTLLGNFQYVVDVTLDCLLPQMFPGPGPLVITCPPLHTFYTHPLIVIVIYCFTLISDKF